MNRKYLAFDIETAKIIPGRVDDLKAHRPLGITCAATLCNEEGGPRLWHGKTSDQQPTTQMSQIEAAELVNYLSAMTNQGYTILTWNGLGFDFDILAEESGMADECKQFAHGHVDMMFHIFCQLGYPIGLDPAAKAMGLPGKPATVSGELAPKLWADGRTDEVLNYVAQDVQNTLQLAHKCEQAGSLRWITRKGSISDMRLPSSGWLTVDAALRLPEPDTSWMSNPMQRSKFTDWL